MSDDPNFPGSRDAAAPYDLVGIGFGPANMALGALLQEEAEAGRRDVRRLFLEAKPEPAWHPGLLLDESLIQITVLKDLATVRNPRSRFTFLCYLQERGRLFEFLNLRNLFPGRIEFNDYLGWVAGQLARDLRCGHRVESLQPVHAAGGNGVELLEIVATDAATGEMRRFRSRNAVVATGGRPWTPPGIELSPTGRAFHARDFLMRLRRDFPDHDAPYRFVIVGAGQTGAELFLHLVKSYPNADVTATMRRYGYKPVDESEFTNQVFFPEMVDFVYDLPEGVRQRAVDSYRDVNYAVVDAPLIRKIYRFLYDEKVVGRQRARVLPYRQLTGLREEGDRAVAELRHALHPEQHEELAADAVILATGFEWSNRHPLLEPLAPWLVAAEDGGGWAVDRDYGLTTHGGFEPRVYLQGYCESTHGIGETVMSLLPMRAQDIWRSLEQRLAAGARRDAEAVTAT